MKQDLLDILKIVCVVVALIGFILCVSQAEPVTFKSQALLLLKGAALIAIGVGGLAYIEEKGEKKA